MLPPIIPPFIAATTSVREGCPWVIVPVLSSTTVSTVCAVSSPSAERISTPCMAPFPVATMIDRGVARPSAHWQAMMSTATADTSASVSAGEGPASSQITNVHTAMSTTAGTK